jgi:uncharacterized membrane protein YraQ (UPF0718 family)
VFARVNQFFHIFFCLLKDSAPWFLLGAALGAALETWLPARWAERWMAGGHRSVVAAAVAGALLPGCAMSTMPVASGLKTRGARLGTLAAFIMVAPLLSPHTVLLSTVMLGWPLTLMRVVVALTLSVVLGFLLNALENRHRWFRAATAVPEQPTCACGSTYELKPVNVAIEQKSCCGDEAVGSAPKASFSRAFLKSLRQLGLFFLVGLAVAALLSAWLPHDWAANYLKHGIFAYVAAVGIGLPLYVCDGGEVPLTLALLKMGVGIGPAFAFMLASVGTCFPTMIMSPRIIGVPATVLYVLSTFVAAVGGGLLLSLLMR